MKHSPSP